MRLAEATLTHPTVLTCLTDGLLSLDQAATAVKAPAYLDATIAEQAQVATVPQLRLMVGAANRGPAPRGAADDTEPAPAVTPGEPDEFVSWWFDEAGRFHLRGELEADHGRILQNALTEARDALFRLFRNGRQVSWADALVEIAERSLDGAPVERRERFRANWFVDPADPVPAR